MSFHPIDCLEVPLDKVQITDAFWLEYQRLERQVAVIEGGVVDELGYDEVVCVQPSHLAIGPACQARGTQ